MNAGSSERSKDQTILLLEIDFEVMVLVNKRRMKVRRKRVKKI